MEIADGVHRIDTLLGERINSLWLVKGSRTSLLFDCGIDGIITSDVVPYLDQVSVGPQDIAWAVATHCDVDHFGGIAEVHEALPNARVIAHELDAGLIEDYSRYEAERARGFRIPYGVDEDPDVLGWTRAVVREGPVDLRFRGGEVIDLGNRSVEIVHVPGHSRGHLALRDLRTGVVLISDAVLGAAVPLADGRPAFPPTYRFVDDYLETIERIRHLTDGTLGTAHYGHFQGHAAVDFLDVSREFATKLEQQVIDVLGQTGSMTLAALLAALNPLGSWPQEGTAGALAFPVVGHVERLVHQGSLTVALQEAGEALIKVAA